MKEVFDYELNGEICKYTVLDDVPFSSLLAAIQAAVEMCYTEDRSFHPELADFAKEYMILDTLTDIQMPESVDEAYRYIRAIDGVRSVDADFIADGVEAAVQYNKEMTLAFVQNHGAAKLAEMVAEVKDSAISTLDAVTSAVNKMADATQTADLADVNDLVKALANGKVSQKEMVSTVLDFQKAKKRSRGKACGEADDQGGSQEEGRQEGHGGYSGSVRR